MPKRKRTPKIIENELLIKSARRCCICFGLNADYTVKRGQITHLDHDSSNAKLDNLAWMCIPHHDEYDSIPRQSRGFTRTEAKEYRKMLYKRVEVERSKPTRSIAQARNKKNQKKPRGVTGTKIGIIPAQEYTIADNSTSEDEAIWSERRMINEQLMTDLKQRSRWKPES